jgi:hypothetical protein
MKLSDYVDMLIKLHKHWLTLKRQAKEKLDEYRQYLKNEYERRIS